MKAQLAQVAAGELPVPAVEPQQASTKAQLAQVAAGRPLVPVVEPLQAAMKAQLLRAAAEELPVHQVAVPLGQQPRAPVLLQAVAVRRA